MTHVRQNDIDLNTIKYGQILNDEVSIQEYLKKKMYHHFQYSFPARL